MTGGELDPWFAKGAVLTSLLGLVFLRWPHGRRSATVKICEDRKDAREGALLGIAALGSTFLPILWLTTNLFAFAAYPLRSVPFGLGLVFMLAGLWIFHRSHVDLGTNWSVTLQMREDHRLVTTGVYARVRHPMYSSLLLLGIAQLLFLPNWLVGPAYLVSMGVLYVIRRPHEEQMMVDAFGDEYREYRQRTGALFPRSR